MNSCVFPPLLLSSFYMNLFGIGHRVSHIVVLTCYADIPLNHLTV